MYIDADELQSIRAEYGTPVHRSARFEMIEDEFEWLKRSQKYGRSHDVTMFIRYNDKFIVNAKHFYPSGLYRAPSGGINPGETIETGARREAREETGCEIELREFLLEIEVQFYRESESIDWISYVFLCDYISGDLEPQDTREIKEVALASLEDFERFGQTMLKTDRGGFHYRSFLQQEALELINSNKS
jgi:ADP-ribose pyrophosphatase YjhB (NUDIX family)